MSQEDPEIARITKKADDGALNIVTKILARPEVQLAITKNIAKQTLTSGIFMALLVVGAFTLLNVAKAVVGYNWYGDLILGIIFVTVGAFYMGRQILRKP